ncbi:MAG: histidine kinase [Clostridiales bacterium GWB2_37_7]|nr:MAG: histidine kinase [Clostridiales bacterium GWB2_37_7]
MLKIDRLNEIIKNTVDVIEKSKNEIFDIAEGARRECKHIEDELNLVRNQTLEIIRQVDELKLQEVESRHRLMIVSKNIKEFNENDIRIAYERAKDLQIQFIIKQTEEQQLIQKRSDLERRLKLSRETTSKAESLVSKVGVAMGYLGGGLMELSEQLDDIREKQTLGIKIIKAQEEERKRVAREIHDGPAQLMANLVIKTELCEKLVDKNPIQVKMELNSLKELARVSLKDVRKIIYDLRPMSLDDLGLIPTVQRFIANYIDETKQNVELLVFGEPSALAPIAELAVFRIIQESLNNIRKHAHAKYIHVKLEFIAESIKLIISDDGKGFDKGNVKSKDIDGGYGLLSMKERVDLLNGKLEVISTPGKGTKIFASIPLQINEG